jgi:hypothetical protein
MLEFIDEHRSELVLFAGDPADFKHGFLTKRELSVAAKAGCTVAILIPSQGLAKDGVRGERV